MVAQTEQSASDVAWACLRWRDVIERIASTLADGQCGRAGSPAIWQVGVVGRTDGVLLRNVCGRGDVDYEAVHTSFMWRVFRSRCISSSRQRSEVVLLAADSDVLSFPSWRSACRSRCAEEANWRCNCQVLAVPYGNNPYVIPLQTLISVNASMA